MHVFDRKYARASKLAVARASELANNQVLLFVKIKIIQQEKLINRVLANFSQFGVLDVILGADPK